MAMNEMDMGGGWVMMMPHAWTLGYATVVFCMWTTMMVAMMLPSAAATILRAASLTQEHPGGMSGTPTAMFFTAGYLMVWTGFSGVATLAQWVLDRVGLLSEAMASRSAIASGAVLIVAGLYEMTSVKQAFLRDCRLALHSRGNVGTSVRATVAAGVQLGLCCLGCCWALMGLMFVVGVMNLRWTVGLALVVLIEKTIPLGNRMSRVIGAGLITWGAYTFAIASSR
jgi:predicted metal-binding membrane protein